MNELKRLNLNLGYCNFGDEGLKAFATSLKNRENSRLSNITLSFYKNNFGVYGLRKLLKALETQPLRLLNLNLSNNSLDQEGGNEVLNSISKQECLESLVLNIRNIGHNFKDFRKRVESEKKGKIFKLLTVNH